MPEIFYNTKTGYRERRSCLGPTCAIIYCPSTGKCTERGTVKNNRKPNNASVLSLIYFQISSQDLFCSQKSDSPSGTEAHATLTQPTTERSTLGLSEHRHTFRWCYFNSVQHQRLHLELVHSTLLLAMCGGVSQPRPSHRFFLCERFHNQLFQSIEFLTTR